MTKLEDKCMTIENKMMSLGLKLFGRTRSLMTDKHIMRFGPVKKRVQDDVLGDVQLEIEGMPDTSAYLDGENYICVMFDDPDEKKGGLQ